MKWSFDCVIQWICPCMKASYGTPYWFSLWLSKWCFRFVETIPNEWRINPSCVDQGNIDFLHAIFIGGIHILTVFFHKLLPTFICTVHGRYSLRGFTFFIYHFMSYYVTEIVHAYGKSVSSAVVPTAYLWPHRSTFYSPIGQFFPPFVRLCNLACELLSWPSLLPWIDVRLTWTCTGHRHSRPALCALSDTTCKAFPSPMFVLFHTSTINAYLHCRFFSCSLGYRSITTDGLIG